MLNFGKRNESGDQGRDNPRPKPATTAAASDAELALAARRGDKKAFVEIVARHQAMVCGVALGILGDFAASEDAAQEAFLTAWRKIHELREPARLRAWLGQIARNAALGHLRRVKGHEPLENAPVLADESPSPDEAAANEEEAALVREALAKLPENYRMPLILFYRDGQSVRAVAGTLGISEDAVKQRLARGREMLRERMSGLIENVLTRTGPTPIFTMTIAAAIGALAAPAAVAGCVFAAASVTAGATSTSAAASAPFLTAMSTSKTFLVTAAFVTAVCIPVGYHIGKGKHPLRETNVVPGAKIDVPAAAQKVALSFENSALFAEWRQLHNTHGTTGEAMPLLYKAIADLKDPFRRWAFRAALIAEWVQVDPAGGFAFILGQPDASQGRQFFEEWLAHKPRAAIEALMMTSSPGWERVAREFLVEIARREPSRVADIVARLPKSDNYWDTKVRDAFTIVAEGGLVSARTVAEAMTGPNREQALAGIAQAWAKTDLEGAVAWARALPNGTDHDEIIRAALLGKSSVDPVAALDQVGLVPPVPPGARVLTEAAKTDFDATVAWIAAHPGRLGQEDMMLGLSRTVTERLNADAVGFLDRHAADGSLAAVLPAISIAILNDASGQRATIWEWLKKQPDKEAFMSLKSQVFNAAGYQDPAFAMKMVHDLPNNPAGDNQVSSIAFHLLKGGSMLHRFDKLLEQAPERLRQPLIDTAFSYLRGDTMDDPQRWIARLPQLPEASRAKGTESIARAWADQTPEDAIGWVASLPAGETRSGAAGAIASTWAAKDAYGAAEWIASMPPGAERDRSAYSLVSAIAHKFPREAWDWALSIENSGERDRAATYAVRQMARRDPATARQWIEAGPFTAETKAALQSALQPKNP